MNLIVLIIIIIIIVFMVLILTNSQKEGFWSWNYWRNTPCVEDVFGNVVCDPSLNYLYPNYYMYPNPFLYSGPDVIYRKIRKY